MVRKLLNRRDNEIAAVRSVNASLLRVSVFPRSRSKLSGGSIRLAIRRVFFPIPGFVFLSNRNYYPRVVIFRATRAYRF